MARRTQVRSIRRRGDGERGAASAELVLAVPALLVIILLIAQFAIWAHATNIAHAAAAQALSVTRVQGGTVSTGRTEAGEVLSQLGDGPLREPHVTVHRSAEQSSVVITGTASSVVPFLTLPVQARAVGPSERFVAPGAAA